MKGIYLSKMLKCSKRSILLKITAYGNGFAGRTGGKTLLRIHFLWIFLAISTIGKAETFSVNVPIWEAISENSDVNQTSYLFVSDFQDILGTKIEIPERLSQHFDFIDGSSIMPFKTNDRWHSNFHSEQENNCNAALSYSPNEHLVYFSDRSVGQISQLNWDFGDGHVSSAKNSVHTHDSASVYTVTHKISDKNSKSSYASVAVLAEKGDADTSKTICGAYFLNSIDVYSTSYTYHFFDHSKGNPIKWNWDFGDGNTSTAQNPVHSYDSVGVYIVTLKITGDNCKSSYTSEVLLPEKSYADPSTTIGNAPFLDSTEIYSVSSTYSFFDHSGRNTSQWNCDFGDGNTSTARNSLHSLLLVLLFLGVSYLAKQLFK